MLEPRTAFIETDACGFTLEACVGKLASIELFPDRRRYTRTLLCAAKLLGQRTGEHAIVAPSFQ